MAMVEAWHRGDLRGILNPHFRLPRRVELRSSAAATLLCLAALCIWSRVLMIGRKDGGAFFGARTLRLLFRIDSSDIS